MDINRLTLDHPIIEQHAEDFGGNEYTLQWLDPDTEQDEIANMVDWLCPDRIINEYGKEIDVCICCGEYVPEGRQVCKKCGGGNV